MKQPAEERFKVIVSGPDENIKLAEAALLIAAREYPELDTDSCLRRMDHMAEECRRRLQGESDVGRIIDEMNRYLFAELGFKGDLTTFNDPRNSFLNDVLDRRQGIPISLSVLYMEIGARLGLPIRGVSFPGHFLVKVAVPGGEIVLDPFAGGILLDEAELQRRLMHFSGDQRRAWDLRELLAAAGNKEILSRMLRNLKTVYIEKEDHHRALACVNMMLDIAPGSVAEIRDRAYLHDELDHLRAAMEDYEQYLIMSPQSTDAEYVRARLTELRSQMGRLH